MTLYAKAATLPKRQASRSYRDDDNLSFIFDVIQHHVCADRQKEMVGLKLDRIHKARISSKFSNNAKDDALDIGSQRTQPTKRRVFERYVHVVLPLPPSPCP